MPKVILTTFAGRRDRMELLTWYARAALHQGLIDEWHVWDFSRNARDRAWLRETFPLVRLTPSDNTQYHFSGAAIQAGPQAQRFAFQVSGRHDLHIGLQRLSGEGRSYEIVLGGWGNSRSVIRGLADAARLHDVSRRGSETIGVSARTPGILPEFDFLNITLELSEAGLAVFAAGVKVLALPGPITPGTFKILYHSGLGCNAEWRFPHWPERGAFLFLGAKPTGLRTDSHPVYPQLPFYLPFYQHYAWRPRIYGADIFLKCDDDIVFFDFAGLARLIAFRRGHPEYFLVSASVINNGVCAYFQQRDGLIPKSLMEIDLPPDGHGGRLWQSAQRAEALHYHFLNNPAGFMKAPAIATQWNERLSINFVSWLGQDFCHMSELMLDDEEYLCYQGRWRSGRPNIILANVIAAHLTFFTQEKGMDIAGVLSGYRRLATQLGLAPAPPASQRTA